MKVGRSLRGVRAAVFAAACVGVSAAGHAWMSGTPIAVWALIVAVLAVGGVGYAVAGRQRGFASIAGLMLAGEAGLHLLFSAAQRTTTSVAAGAAASTPTTSATSWSPDMSRIKMAHPIPAVDWLCGHGMDGMRAVAAATTGVPGGSGGSGGGGAMASMPSMAALGMAGMVGVHVAAGLLCAWWLRRGEVATFQLMRALAGFVVPLLVFCVAGARPVPDLTIVVPNVAGARVPRARRLLVHALIRRGPPVLVFSM
ncbi:hypothetical protein [Actinospica robiniae]|uniref:hypothetical protein n=1 Tax=Actinospica robiniae TaxID=304901 RepID=UPI000408972F|nr:hypothetical protein [Actinospica robiniae]